MAKKNFKCEYYQIVENQPNGREPLFDLERWIDNIETKSYRKNCRDYKEDRMRIEEIYFHETYKMWFLRFMRIRSNDNPSLCSEEEASEFMELGDKYVSEDVTCLYDSENGVIMIQKNSHSISPSGIEMYLNQTWEGDETIVFRKVVDKTAFQKARRADKCRKISVRFADVQNVANDSLLNKFTSTIGNAIKSMNNYKFPYCELTFSVGRGSGDLGTDMLTPILKDIEDYPELFDKACVQILEENERKSEFIDLFTDSAKDIITVNIERNNPIRFDAMMDHLANKYCSGEGREFRKSFINRCLLN